MYVCDILNILINIQKCIKKMVEISLLADLVRCKVRAISEDRTLHSNGFNGLLTTDPQLDIY